MGFCRLMSVNFGVLDWCQISVWRGRGGNLENILIVWEALLYVLYGSSTFQVSAAFQKKVQSKIKDLLQQMEEGLKTADPHDVSTYTGWTGLLTSVVLVD